MKVDEQYFSNLWCTMSFGFIYLALAECIWTLALSSRLEMEFRFSNFEASDGLTCAARCRGSRKAKEVVIRTLAAKYFEYRQSKLSLNSKCSVFVHEFYTSRKMSKNPLGFFFSATNSDPNPR
jgi:hypothetical protein